MTADGDSGRTDDTGHYRAIAESISEAAYLVDSDRNLAYTNQSSVQHPAVSLESFRGGPMLDFVGRMVAEDEDPASFERALQTVYDRSADAEFPITVELDIDGPAGTTTTEFRCTPCRTGSGTGALVVSGESVEPRHPEFERYERLCETVPVAVGLSTVGESEEFEFVNQTAVELFDAGSRAQLEQHSPEDLYVEPAEREHVTQRVTEQETVEQYETEFQALDGTHLEVSITAELIEIGGEPRIVEIVEDISERKRREQELRKEKEFIDGILNSLPDVFYAFDAEGSLIEYNDRLSSVTGYESGELEEMTPWEFFPEDERAMIIDAVSQVVETGQPVHALEGHYLTKAGETIPYEFSGAPFYDSGGAVAGFVGFGRDVSDRKMREQELRENRERLQGLFDEAPDPIFVQDEEGTLTDVNEKAVEKLGYSREELREMSVADIDTTVDRSRARELLSTLKSEERTMKVESRHRCADGSTYPVEVRVTPLETDGKDRFLSHARDISERKEREAELERKQEFLAQTQEVANIGGWEVDLRTDSLRWTDEVYQIHGLDREFEPSVGDAIDLYHPDDRVTIQEAVERVTNDGESYDMEVRVVRPGGEVRWTRARGEPWYHDGEVVGARGTFQDITDRKEREQELTRKTRAIEAAPLGVTISDPDREDNPLIYANERFREVTGYTAEEVLGRNCRFLQGEQTDAEQVDRIRAGIEQQRPMTTVLRNYRQDGEQFWNRVSIAPVTDETGDLLNYVGFQQDITEQREREEELQTINEQLEVLNRILRHDIRNDVQVIGGWTEKLQRELPEAQQQDLQRIRQTNESIKELTENGKALIQAFTGEEQETEPVRLDDILQGELESARSRYPTADFTVEETVSSATVSANGTLSSVIRNLLNNAVQHNSGHVSVTVRVEQGEESVRLAVVDNGIGVPDDRKEEIFGKGERGLESDGTGIGLYLVNQLVQSYGGAVWVEDGEQHGPDGEADDPDGAVFVVELPAATG